MRDLNKINNLNNEINNNDLNVNNTILPLTSEEITVINNAHYIIINNTVSPSNNTTMKNFIFSPLQIASHDYRDDTDGTNNWISVYNDTDGSVVDIDNTWTDNQEQAGLLSKGKLADLFNIYINSHRNGNNNAYRYYGVESNDVFKYSRKVHIEGNDTDPAYSCRGVLPIFNSNNNVKFYVKIKHIGNSGAGSPTGPFYNLWGIGIMRKFNSFDDSGSNKHVNASNTDLKNSWDTSSRNLAAPYALEPQEASVGTSNSKIFQSNKIMIRMVGDTNLYSKDIDVPFYGRLNASVSPANGSFTIDNLVGFSRDINTSTITGILDDYRVIGLGNASSVDINTVTYSADEGYQINLTSGTVAGNFGDYVGFTKLTGDISVNNIQDGGQPTGMGYNYHKSYGTDTHIHRTGESMSFADWAHRGGGTTASQPAGTTPIISASMVNASNSLLVSVGGVVGFEIGEASSVNTDRSVPIKLITFYGQKDDVDLGNGSGKKVILAQKEVPELYFDSDNKLHTIESLNSDSLLDGPWCPFVLDSTGASHTTERDITLEIINHKNEWN